MNLSTFRNNINKTNLESVGKQTKLTNWPYGACIYHLTLWRGALDREMRVYKRVTLEDLKTSCATPTCTQDSERKVLTTCTLETFLAIMTIVTALTS